MSARLRFLASGMLMSVAVGFRPLQAIHDLVALARRMPEATLLRLAAGTPASVMSPAEAREALVTLVHRDACRFSAGRTAPLHETLLLAASLPDDDFDAFVTATAILLADRLQEGPGPDDLAWHWDAFADHYALADPPQRAALLQGFHAMVETGQLPPDLVDVPAVSGVDRDLVLSDLREIAQAATEEELETIAAADHGHGKAAHLAALRSVISEQGCVLLPGQDRVPSEVVELASHVPERPGHLVATAVLLATALTRGDDMGWFDYRWEQQARTYLALPAGPRWAVLSAIRYLYESDPGFTPYPQALFDPADHRAVLIPALTRADRPVPAT
jgi:hypothetical protein